MQCLWDSEGRSLISESDIEHPMAQPYRPAPPTPSRLFQGQIQHSASSKSILYSQRHAESLPHLVHSVQGSFLFDGARQDLHDFPKNKVQKLKLETILRR